MSAAARPVEGQVEATPSSRMPLVGALRAALGRWCTPGIGAAGVLVVQLAAGIAIVEGYRRGAPASVFVHAAHHWGAAAMVALLSAHVVRVVTTYAREGNRRRIDVLAGASFLVVALGVGFARSLLPWDGHGSTVARAATVVAGAPPLVGPVLAWLLHLGVRLGGASWMQFARLHFGVLPLFAVLVGLVHRRLVMDKLGGVIAAATPPRPHQANWVKVADDVKRIPLAVPFSARFVRTTERAGTRSQSPTRVWLYTDDGRSVRAFSAYCPHRGNEYVHDKRRKCFFCPAHTGRFDIKTGRVLAGPSPRGLDELPAEVRDGAVYVDYHEFRLGIPKRVEA